MPLPPAAIAGGLVYYETMNTTIHDLTLEQRNVIISFLQKFPVGVLATCSDNGSPQASAIYVGCDDNLRLTFTTKQGTGKYDSFKRDNRLVLVVFDAASQTSVQVYGRATELDDPVAVQRVFQATIGAAGQTGTDIVPPIAKVAAGPYAGFEIEVDTIKLSEYGWGDSFIKALEHADKPHATGDPA